MKKAKVEACKSCGGKGYIEFYSHVLDGVCFACVGTGNKLTREQRDKYMAKLQGRKFITKEETINGLIISIADLYNKVTKPLIKSKEIIENRREQAKVLWNELKKMNAKLPTLEEIQLIAKGLEVWNKKISQTGMMERANLKQPTIEELKQMGREG